MADYTSAYTGAEIDEAIGFSQGGAARARVAYDQTTPSILSSENVSSVTDNSAGTYTVNFNSSMANSDFSKLSGNIGFSGGYHHAASSLSVTSSSVSNLTATSGNGATDNVHSCVGVFGDLA